MSAVQFLPSLIFISLQWTVKHLELTLAFPLERGGITQPGNHIGDTSACLCFICWCLCVSVRAPFSHFHKQTKMAAADVVTRSVALIGRRSVQLRREAFVCVRWPLITPFGKKSKCDLRGPGLSTHLRIGLCGVRLGIMCSAGVMGYVITATRPCREP